MNGVEDTAGNIVEVKGAEPSPRGGPGGEGLGDEGLARPLLLCTASRGLELPGSGQAALRGDMMCSPAVPTMAQVLAEEEVETQAPGTSVQVCSVSPVPYPLDHGRVRTLLVVELGTVCSPEVVEHRGAPACTLDVVRGHELDGAGAQRSRPCMAWGRRSRVDGEGAKAGQALTGPSGPEERAPARAGAAGEAASPLNKAGHISTEIRSTLEPRP